jgi:hypothetical protein
VPSVDGYTFLINNNNATDFGANQPGVLGPVFNQENVYINSFVNLITGNTTAAADFAAILGGATTLPAALTAVYNSMVPVADQNAAGRAFFLSEASYYTLRATGDGLTSLVGEAAVAAGALANILVNSNVPGLGQEINQFTIAVANGTAAVPQDGSLFTPILTAIGTGSGTTFTLTTGVDVIPGLIGNLGTTVTGNDTIIGQNIEVAGSTAGFTMNPADQIDAGTGINTFKLFADGTAAAVAQAQFPILTNVENLWINHFGANTLDLTTAQFAQLTAVQLDNVDGGGTGGISSHLIVSHDAVTFSNDSSANGNGYFLSSVADTSENVTVNGVGVTGGHAGLNAAFNNGTQTSATVTGLTINSVGAANFLNFGSDTANPLSSITFAHSAAGDTAFTGNNGIVLGSVGSTSAETIDASAFTAALTLGTTGVALAVATGFGDSGSGFGDTVKLGSGTTYFAEHAVAASATGDTITLLAGHTAVDTIDSTATSNAAATYTVAQQNQAMSKITNFNLVGTSFTSGDILKIGITSEAVGTATDINANAAHDVWTNVGTTTGFVSGGSLTQFLTDVSTGAHTAHDTIAYTDGTNTYVAHMTGAGAGQEQVVELVGVHTATALSLAASATGQIHIA